MKTPAMSTISSKVGIYRTHAIGCCCFINDFTNDFLFRLVPEKGMFGPVIFDVNIYNTSSSKDYILLISVLPESVIVMLNSNVSKINIPRYEDSSCNSPVNVKI